jgi:hypothetical protein
MASKTSKIPLFKDFVLPPFDKAQEQCAPSSGRRVNHKEMVYVREAGGAFWRKEKSTAQNLNLMTLLRGGV